MAKLKNEYSCSLLLTHDLIGGKWKLRILWHIIHGDNRFSLLTKAIPNISEKVLGTHLKELEKDGLLNRTVLDDKPPMVVVYSIAPQYIALTSLIENICSFTTDYAVSNGICIGERIDHNKEK